MENKMNVSYKEVMSQTAELRFAVCRKSSVYDCGYVIMALFYNEVEAQAFIEEVASDYFMVDLFECC